MVSFYPDLWLFCECQAERLVELASDCTDPNTRQKLIAMALEYRKKGQLRGEMPVRSEATVTICGWRH
jgi:hypothetical protein